MSNAMPHEEDCEFAEGDRVKFRGSSGELVEGIVFDVCNATGIETVCIAYIHAKHGAQYVYRHACLVLPVEAAPAAPDHHAEEAR